MTDLGTLTRLDPRQVWSGEATHFTPWLAAHIDELSKALGIELEINQVESDVGDFSLDILARDLGSNRTVIIENQLEPTDHTHLGQLLTYAAGKDAGVVIWIAREFREEHRQALDWLNARESEVQYFGVVIEVLQIDTSRPAVHFRIVASPNDWSRTARSSAKSSAEVSEKGERYRAFFQSLLDELREKHHFTNARTAQPQNWYSFASKMRDCPYSFSFAAGNRLRAELYIDAGDADENERILVAIQNRRAEIEAAFGESLSWELLEGKRACRVAVYAEGSIDDPADRLEKHRAWAVQKLEKFKEVFPSRVLPLLTPRKGNGIGA
jgi:hypothetical protein